MTLAAPTLEACRALDAADPLRAFRDRFALPEGVVYLDGNSLGALPRATAARVAVLVEREWGTGLIRSWNDAGWFDLPQRLGAKIARLVGAAPGQVVACDSTSVNLFKSLDAALALRPGRSRIVAERGNFPTDLYVAHGLAQRLGQGHRLDLVDDVDALDAALDDDVAVVLLSHVDYRSARLLDMPALTARIHAAGAIAVWDLSHSAGALPVELDASGVDFAVGCGYKYLNGGPGAPAFVYAAARHHATLAPLLCGWFGHAAPFDFEPAWRGAPGIDRLLVGTPPMLSLAALEVGVDLMLEVDLAALRTKSIRLAETFIALADERLADRGFTLRSPRDAGERGSHVVLAHARAWPLMQALIRDGVIGDMRAPDLLRFGFTPLYTRFEDVWTAIDRLVRILDDGRHDDPALEARRAVT